MKDKYGRFGMFIPNLPKPGWDQFKEVGQRYQMSARQVLMLALHALDEMGKRDPEGLETTAQYIRKLIEPYGKPFGKRGEPTPVSEENEEGEPETKGE